MSDEGGIKARGVFGTSVPIQNIPTNRKAFQDLRRAMAQTKKPKAILEVTKPPPTSGLFDHRGDPVFEGSVTLDEVKDAMRAASDAGHYDQAEDIAKRYGLHDLCPRCAGPLDPDPIILNPYTESPFIPGGLGSFDSQIRAFQTQQSHKDSTKVNCHGRRVRLCEPCFQATQTLDAADLRIFKQGLISRNVQ